MRLTLWGIALLLLGLIAGTLLGHALSQYQQALLEKQDQDVPTSRRVARVDFRQTAFEQAVEDLHHEARANIIVNWPALEAAGIERTAPISLCVSDLSLGRVLHLVCCQAARDDTRLGMRVDDGAIIVSTQDDLARRTVLRVYDVRDLIVADHDLRDHIRRMLEKVKSGYGEAASDPGLVAQVNADSVESLIKAIEAVIEPDTWRDAGGTVGTVREFGGRLLIIQTPENHTRIAELLDQLRNS